MEQSEWLNTEEVSTTEFDKAVQHLAEMDMEYDQVSKLMDEAKEKREAARAAVLTLLEKSGKSKYNAEGFGTVSKIVKYTVTTPKQLEDKKAMFEHFASLGEEAYTHYLSVNSQTLNAYFNQEKENNPDFKIPGVGEPTALTQLRFTKERKK